MAFMRAQISGREAVEWMIRDDGCAHPESSPAWEDDGTCERVRGFGARLSADGYLDCTDWIVCDTMAAAAAELLAMYFDDRPIDEYDDDERDDIAWLESIVREGAESEARG